jgi:CDP-diacylglycerol--glycerol-3-phosphate 3-phosphatidyltransferase
MTLPNALTLLRIFFVPLLLTVLLGKQVHVVTPWMDISKEWLALPIFWVAALTDLLDGAIARRRRQISTLGTLLDPVADKLLISAMFISLVELGLVPAWMVVVIVGREFAVSGLRSIAAAEGYTIQASDLGKTKMVMQVVAVSLLLVGAHSALFLKAGLVAVWLVSFLRWFRRSIISRNSGAAWMPVSRCGAAAGSDCCFCGSSEKMLPLSSAARRWLLDLARAAVDAAGRGEPIPAPEVPPDLPLADQTELARPYAVFVSLHKQGQLRGCVGHIGFETPLRQLVPEMAQAAALDDARFDPVSPEEVPDLDIEISVLSRFFPIEPDQIVPGVHGLLARRGIHRGILLPQVALEHNWDAVRFLNETCRKAGLPPDAWTRGATIEAFTADIIGEEKHSATLS